MAEDIKPPTAQDLKHTFWAASQDFKQRCMFSLATEAQDFDALDSAYDTLQVHYYEICPNRGPLSELIHRIQRLFIRILTYLENFLSGNPNIENPLMRTKAIKKEFEFCHRLYRACQNQLDPSFSASSTERENPPAVAPARAKRAHAAAVPTLASQGIPAVGLQNEANNCWCNSLLQIIVHTPSLREMYLTIARSLKEGPTNENRPYFNALATHYVNYSNAMEESIRLHEQVANADAEEFEAQFFDDFENDDILSNIFIVPQEWNPAHLPNSQKEENPAELPLPSTKPIPPAPKPDEAPKQNLNQQPSAFRKMLCALKSIFITPQEPNPTPTPNSKKEKNPAAPLPTEPAHPTPKPDGAPKQSLSRQAHLFRKMLRAQIKEKLENLPDQFTEALKNAKLTKQKISYGDLLGQVFEHILKEAWDAACAMEGIPHLSQEEIEEHIVPRVLVWVETLDKGTDKEQKVSMSVHRKAVSDLCRAQIFPALKPQDKKLLSCLANTQEKAIEMGKIYGAALEDALDAYQKAFQDKKSNLHPDISQNVRLAFHFLTPPNPFDVLDPAIHQTSNQQADASEAFAQLFNAYLGLTRADPEDLTFSTIKTTTYERTDNPLVDPVADNPQLPAAPVEPITVFTDWEELQNPIDDRVAEINRQIAALQTYRTKLTEYKPIYTTYKSQCTDLERRRQTAAKELETITANLENPEEKYSVVDGIQVTRPPEITHTHFLTIQLPTPQPVQKNPNGLTLTSNLLSKITTFAPKAVAAAAPKPLLTDLLKEKFSPNPENKESPIFIHEGNAYRYKAIEAKEQLDRYPSYLPLCLDRFVQDDFGRRTKNQTLIDVPLQLQLPEGVVKEAEDPLLGAILPPPKIPSPSAEKRAKSSIELPEESEAISPPKEEEEEAANPSPIYELDSFFIHSGASLSAGHYIACWKDHGTGEWIEGNDGSTKKITEENALKAASTAYMLFYRNTSLPFEDHFFEAQDIGE